MRVGSLPGHYGLHRGRPDHFIASGHPDFQDPKLLKAGRPPLLGLVESGDPGHSWEPASLLGEVDFHVLEVAHGKVYGFDATGGWFMVSRDRRRWQTRSTASLVDFAVSPVDGEFILAANERGLMCSVDGGRTWRPAGEPTLALLEWVRPEALWAVAGDGQVWRSVNAGRTWEHRGELGGPRRAMMLVERTPTAMLRRQSGGERRVP
jgi:hypothetical protein